MKKIAMSVFVFFSVFSIGQFVTIRYVAAQGDTILNTSGEETLDNNGNGTGDGTKDQTGDGTKDQTGSGTKTSSDSSKSLTNPLGNVTTVQGLIQRILSAALGIVGSLALLMFIYGGFTWMLAAGNAEAVKRGKDIFIWATIGLVVIFSSYAIVNFIITSATT